MSSHDDHDERFQGVDGCLNGCLACQVEHLEQKLRISEAQLDKVAEYVMAVCGKYYQEDVENDTLADAIIRKIIEREDSM